MLALLELNKLKSTDIVFFIVLAVIVVLCIGVYFLIPVFNKKQYKEQRDNLRKREVAFKSNISRSDAPASGAPADGAVKASADEAPTGSSENEEK